jgi:type IV secretory pathway TraG/TraD family ATPase VirD4
LIDKNEIEDVLARRLLIDTALDLLNKNSKTSFGEILEKINQSEEDIAIYLQKYLEPWSNPLVRNATSSSDFDLRKFRDEKSTLYVIVNNNNINRLQPLLKFMYQHFFDILTSQPHSEIKDKSGVRFFLDEVATLGKMKELELGMGYFRGYKIGLFLTVQNLQQLQSAYGDDAISLINNASFRISFHTNDFETANFVSSLCLNQDGFSWKDLISLPKDEMIYFDEHSQAIKQKKFKYFENEEFKKRVDL